MRTHATKYKFLQICSVKFCSVKRHTSRTPGPGGHPAGHPGRASWPDTRPGTRFQRYTSSFRLQIRPVPVAHLYKLCRTLRTIVQILIFPAVCQPYIWLMRRLLPGAAWRAHAKKKSLTPDEREIKALHCIALCGRRSGSRLMCR